MAIYEIIIWIYNSLPVYYWEKSKLFNWSLVLTAIFLVFTLPMLPLSSLFLISAFVYLAEGGKVENFQADAFTPFGNDELTTVFTVSDQISKILSPFFLLLILVICYLGIFHHASFTEAKKPWLFILVIEGLFYVNILVFNVVYILLFDPAGRFGVNLLLYSFFVVLFYVIGISFAKNRKQLLFLHSTKLASAKKTGFLTLRRIIETQPLETSLYIDELVTMSKLSKGNVRWLFKQFPNSFKGRWDAGNHIFHVIDTIKKEPAPGGVPAGGILVFISYATRDAESFGIKEIAERLTTYDEISDVLYWQEDMHDNIITYMNENLVKADVVLLFCSENALRSEPVEKEWTAAEAMGKRIIPVFTKVEDIPPLLRSRLGVQYDQYDFQKNIEGIHELVLKKSTES